MEFDPDKFSLEKDDIKLILQSIEKRWEKNKKGNLQYIMMIKAMKTGLILADSETVSKVWKDIINCINAMIQLNGMNQLSEEDGRKNIAVLRDMVREKIERGEII